MAIFEPKLSTPALALVLLAGDVYAQPQSTVQDPQALVREVVMNELRAQQDDQTHWMYVSREGSRETDQTEEVIETRYGVISRIIAENGFTQMTFRSSSLSCPLPRARQMTNS